MRGDRLIIENLIDGLRSRETAIYATVVVLGLATTFVTEKYEAALFTVGATNDIDSESRPLRTRVLNGIGLGGIFALASVITNQSEVALWYGGMVVTGSASTEIVRYLSRSVGRLSLFNRSQIDS